LKYILSPLSNSLKTIPRRYYNLSTETAVLKVTTDILLAIWWRQCSDNAIFDSVDLATQLQRVKTANGSDRKGIKCHLGGRMQSVHSSKTNSLMSTLLFRAQQGLVLDPYTTVQVDDLLQLMKRHQLQLNGYANDTQIRVPQSVLLFRNSDPDFPISVSRYFSFFITLSIIRCLLRPFPVFPSIQPLILCAVSHHIVYTCPIHLWLRW